MAEAQTKQKVHDLHKHVREQRFSRRKQRKRKKDLNRTKRQKFWSIAFRLVVCVAVLALFLFLALMVGDSDNKATLIGWVPFIAILTGLIFSAIYLAILRSQLTFSEETVSSTCERGKTVRFDIHLANRSPLFVFQAHAYVFVSDMFGNNASEDRVSLTLAPFEETTISLDMAFDHIGTYTAGLEKVVVKDFLGLFSFEKQNVHRNEVSVTPHLQLLEQLEFSNDAMLETTKAAKSVLADSMDYSHVREYVPGDPLKTIHWKLSARGGDYLTKLFEVYTNPGVGIVFDFYGPSREALELMSMFDAVVESAFSIASYAQQRGMETEMFFRDKRGENRRLESWGSGVMPELVADMPQMSNDPADAQAAISILRDQIASQYGQNNIVVCSANVNSELVSMIIEAKLHRRAPMMVAVIPVGIDGRKRDEYCAPLSRLDAADIPYMVIASSDDLVAITA